MPLKSLRFLSVRGNFLRRITVEELKATPNLASLDMTNNPLNCDSEFTEAVQWLTDHGVEPIAVHELVSDTFDSNIEDVDDSNSRDLQWTDLAKTVCDGLDDGPPSRSFPGKGSPQKDILDFDGVEDSDPLLRNKLDNDEKLNIDHGMQHIDEPRLEDQEYDEGYAVTTEYHTWYHLRPGFKIWLVSSTVLSVLVVFLLVARIACCLANKQGCGPVIRPPLIKIRPESLTHIE